MDFDRNYMGYYPMMGHIENCPMQCPKMDKCMQGNCMEKWEANPNMCGKYMHMYDNMHMPYGMRGEYMMPYTHHIEHNVEPIESMCGKTYKILIVYVHKTMQKIMMENMGVMPKAISKEKFKKEMNDMICQVMKNEEDIKKIVVVDRNETEETEGTDRAFCPYCNGLLRDTLNILFITELLKGGCVSCY